MAGWLKRVLRGNDNRENAQAAPSPPLATGNPTQRRSDSQARNGPNRSGTLPPDMGLRGGRSSHQQGEPRRSAQDLTMTASVLDVEPPAGRTQDSVTTSRPDLQQQSQDADLALAYAMAQQHASADQQFHPAPPPLLPPGVTPGRFGEALSLPPPARGERPDLVLAQALADSEFTARQAEEFHRSKEALYNAAIDQALEASLQTVNYDGVLRDIKMWTIDLSASTDDMLTALSSVVRRREEVAYKLEDALLCSEGPSHSSLDDARHSDSERRIRKYTWLSEQLPIAETRVRDLIDRVAPVGVAVAQLEDLRETVMEVSPPVDDAERQRDAILRELFKSMGAAGIHWPEGSDVDPGCGSSQQVPAALRDLITVLIDDATRLPPLPRRRSSRGFTPTSSTTGTELEDEFDHGETSAAGAARVAAAHGPEDDAPSSLFPTAPAQPLDKAHNNELSMEPLVLLKDEPVRAGAERESTTHREVAPPACEESPVCGPITAIATPESYVIDVSMSSKSSPTSPSSSKGTAPGSRRAQKATTPVPFHLSTNRTKSKTSGVPPIGTDTLRRVPALISLHYELTRDKGPVAETVGWVEMKSTTSTSTSNTVIALAPAPEDANTRSFDSVASLVEYVDLNNKGVSVEGEIGTLPRFVPGNRWSVQCAAAGTLVALQTAIDALGRWEVPPGASTVSESRRLVDYLNKVSILLRTVAHPYDPLRQAITKSRLPWDDNLVLQVRWAVQYAAESIMMHAIAASEEAERVRGTWQRQAVVQPLGHALMAGFCAHQLAGGFGHDTGNACDRLLERTVHYARLIDPKWFRGTRVVTS